MTKKIDIKNDWTLQEAIDKIISKNCVVIPYEGTEVDKIGIRDDILNFLATNHYSLLKHIKT